MSRDHRKDTRPFYNRDRDRDWDRDRDRDRERERDRDRDRGDYRSRPLRKRSRSPSRRDGTGNDKRRSRSPRKNDKDLIDENILSEISKLPEPSELWDSQSQFTDAGFSGQPQPPPTFVAPPPEGVPTTSFSNAYQPSYSGIYDDFPSVGGVPQAPLPPDMAAWNQMSLPPPPQPTLPAPFVNVEDQIKKEAAIESEMRHQKAALSKQREDYIKKANILKKELDTLKDQRNELRGDAKRSPSPDTKRFLKENTKLQLEIQNKLKTIYNVVDMLNGIIGEDVHEIPEDDSESTDRSSKRKSRSPSNKKFNYVYYDPEMHWCRVCNDFPPTAKDYLNHLHSAAHQKMAAAHMEAPWHTVSGVNEGFPNYPAAPTKRTPIKGLQFFVPSTAWYCKLCDQFVGDLHCASAHLKSVTHSKNYTNFVEQNPHWETDWMSDRQKSFEKSRASKGKTEEKPAQYTSHTITFNKDGFHTKRKDSPPASDEKKKKKDKKKKTKKQSSSSSSSDSSSSDSEPVKKKKASKTKKQRSKVDMRDDKSLTEWMSNIQMNRLNDSDRKLLDTLKSRIKKDKVDDDKRRTPDRSDRDRSTSELSRKMRESERRESRSREERRREDRDTPPRVDTKKPEIRKMPFIGKMPVYKHLGKTSKTEEQKKEETKKKEEEEASKKRREEMDAEIQKKVAEFKEKIARAQLERQQQAELPAGALAPPALALPTQLGTSPALAYLPPPAPQPQAAPAPAPAPVLPAPPQHHMPAPTPQPPQPTLPKDFQEALDIIFPTEVKGQDLGQGDGLFPLPPQFMPGLGGVMPPFPPLPLMQTQMTQMFGFDLNSPLFQPRPQLYDTHVPLVPSPKPRPQHKNNNNRHLNNKKPDHQRPKPEPPKPKQEMKKQEENGNVAKKKEEMDDLAMLGIDASDVGCI